VPFRFELSWFSHPEILTKVKEIRDSPCHAETVFDRIQKKTQKIEAIF
jgi:hypothetical protein